MKKSISHHLLATTIFLVLSKAAEFFIFNIEKTSDQYIRDVFFILAFFTLPLILFDYCKNRDSKK